MLRKLRIQLTLLYLLAATVLVAVMGGWLYYRMATYFQTTTDLALKYRLAMELRLLAAPVSPELEEAEQEFLEQSKSEGLFPTPTEEMDEDDEEEEHGESTLTVTLTPSYTAAPQATSKPPRQSRPTEDDSEDDETEDKEKEDEEKEEEDKPEDSESSSSGNARLAKLVDVTLIPTIVTTPMAVENHSEPDLDDIYFSEVTSIYVLNLDDQGALIPELNRLASPLAPSLDAVKAARNSGTDLRNVVMKNGTPFRLLTYRVPDGYPAEFIQVGRPIDEHARLLKQYVTDLMIFSLILLVVLGFGSWWLAGKTLLPTQKSLELQQAFVANASHELRTPLTLIRASTELAQRGLPEGERKHWLQDALNDVDYMSKLVEDLLLLSRLDHQRIKLELSAVRVDELLLQIARQAEILVQGKQIEISVDAGPVTITADPERLKQVLWILIDNAIHHSSASGKISLLARTTSKLVEIAVQDTGTGIQPADMPHVFERFYKARSGVAASRGAGLGLSIAESLVRAQNGRISLESKVGVGTTVSLLFPNPSGGTATKPVD